MTEWNEEEEGGRKNNNNKIMLWVKGTTIDKSIDPRSIDCRSIRRRRRTTRHLSSLWKSIVNKNKLSCRKEKKPERNEKCFMRCIVSTRNEFSSFSLFSFHLNVCQLNLKFARKMCRWGCFTFDAVSHENNKRRKKNSFFVSNRIPEWPSDENSFALRFSFSDVYV